MYDTWLGANDGSACPVTMGSFARGRLRRGRRPIMFVGGSGAAKTIATKANNSIECMLGKANDGIAAGSGKRMYEAKVTRKE